MSTTACTNSIPKGIRVRTIIDLCASIEFYQRHCDKLKVEAKTVKKIDREKKDLLVDLLACPGED